jgi:hypothetical protein
MGMSSLDGEAKASLAGALTDQGADAKRRLSRERFILFNDYLKTWLLPENCGVY